jgi:CHAT domain-containing protein
MRDALGRTPPDFRSRVVLVDALARIYIECGRADDAQRLLRLDPRQNRLINAELATAKHRYEVALRIARQATCAGDEDACWQAPLIAARALEHLGRRDQAIAKLEESIREIERRRSRIDANEIGRARFFELRLEPYRDLLDLYVRAGRARDALRIAETVKARALLDTLSLGRPDLRAALTPAEEERRRQLDGRIDHLNRALLKEPAGSGNASLERDRTAARRELEEFDAEMGLRHPLGRGLRSSELSQKLDAIVPSAGVAAIEYAVLPRSLLAFVVTRAADGRISVHAKRIGVTAPAIARRVAVLQRTIAARSLASEGQLAQLYDLLIAPLRLWTSGKKLLFVVPDGPLWQVPFQALGMPSGQPMIAETAVAYAPSFAALTAVHTHPREERRTLLAMGDATIGSEATSRIRSFNRDAGLGSLADAANEVRAIAAEYGPRQSDVYLHDAATETMLKASAGHHRVIHLATHGIADSRWPMFSALVLAPTEQDDGLLEAREVAGMKLDADLVVLSACNTAGGLIRSGEGVIGLSWAFLLAGCPTTVVSQWSAESKATSQLMIEFHRRLLGGVTVPEALRQAQLSVMRDNRYRHPFYWAAFVVIGQP